jgi:hypothetical protein
MTLSKSFSAVPPNPRRLIELGHRAASLFVVFKEF